MKIPMIEALRAWRTNERLAITPRLSVSFNTEPEE